MITLLHSARFGVVAICLSLCWLSPLCLPVNAEEMTAQTLLGDYIENVTDEHADVERAIRALKTGDLLQARALLEAARGADPALPPAGIMLARMLYAAKQPALARVELEKVGQSEEGDPDVLLMLAEEALAKRSYAVADLAFRKSSELAKEFSTNEYRKKNMITRVSLGLATIAEARENWVAAADLLKDVVDDGGDVTSVLRLARSLFKSGDTAGSLAILQKHWESDPTNMQHPELTQGLLYHEAKNVEESVKFMNIAATQAGDDEATQLKVAHWALQSGNLELAKKCADQALAASKSSLESRLLSALVARYEEDYPEAKKLLESVHLESPANLSAVIQLAIVLVDMDGMKAQGIQYAQLGVKIQPDLRSAAGKYAGIALAWVMYKDRRQSEAEKILQQVLGGGQLGVEGSYFAASILMGGDERAVAKSLLKKALDSGQTFPGRDKAKSLYDRTNW